MTSFGLHVWLHVIVFQYPCFLADVHFPLKPQNVNPSINQQVQNEQNDKQHLTQSVMEGPGLGGLAAEHTASNTDRNGNAIFRLSI